jgi:hypothetical protein
MKIMSSKALVLAVIVLFIGAGFVPSISSDEPASKGTIYVNDDADPGWYDATHVKTIQEGNDNASAGDTVFVYGGTYYENVDITKDGISLIGEDKNTTIIDGSLFPQNSGYRLVDVSASGVTITNFTILYGDEGNYEIRVKAHDIHGAESPWSDSLVVSMPKQKLTVKNILFEIVHKNPVLMTLFEKIMPYLRTNDKTNGDTEYWALLVAVGEYLNNPEQDRPSMLDEVENLYDTLIASDNWESSHIRKIKGQNANLENILQGFRWLLQMEDKNDISLVYITTHGYYLPFDMFPVDESDGKDEILVPYEGFDDTSKFLWDDEINFFLNLLQSKGVCFIVDSCYSGGFNDALQLSFLENEQPTQHFLNGFLEDLAGDAGRVILMSSEENEVSYGSRFTHYICQGLEGTADANQDMCVSAEEAFQYAEPFILQHGRQHPTMVDTYQGELLLTGEISINTNIKQTIVIQEKDKHGIENEWSDSLPITMPKNKAINPFLLFLERPIERFPILEQILQSI